MYGNYRRSERGVLLVLTVFVVFIVAAVSSSLMTISTAGANREKARDFKFKSREIAEAALDMSLNSLRQATDSVDNDNDGQADEGIEEQNLFSSSTVAKLEGNLGRLGSLGWTSGSDSNGNGIPDFGEQGVTPIALSGGDFITYSVFSEADGVDNDKDGVTDEADEAGSVSIVAQGRHGDYSSTVRYSGIFTETLSPPNPVSWVPNAAFVSGGDLKVTGNCDIIGTMGNIHSNKYMDLGGSSSVSGDATSSGGGCINPGSVGGVVNTSAPEVMVPDVNLSNMQMIRDSAVSDAKDVYLLNNDGSITKGGIVVANGVAYHGWSLSGDTWTLSSNKADLDGLFYSTTNVKLTGGKVGISMTVLSEGNVTISGNGKFTSYYQDFFLVSLKDIKLSGTPQQGGSLGIILAREQVQATGNVDIKGAILAADLDNASGFVESTSISDLIATSLISGNFDIEYNGGLTTTLPVYDPNSGKFKFDPTFSAYEER